NYEFFRGLRTDVFGQQGCDATSDKEPISDFRKKPARCSSKDPEVAIDRPFQRAADTPAMNGGNDDLFRSDDLQGNCLNGFDPRLRGVSRGSLIVEILQIIA